MDIALNIFGYAELTKVTLVQDLAWVLLVAGVVATIFHCLGWPKVIGYIAAGALIRVEPFKSLMIANEESINVLANLGVIFLMLNLGLDLKIRKLRRAGGTLFPAAALDLAMMLLFGYLIGRHVLGWGLIPSLFMGAVICDSSTTLLAKSLAEMGCEKERFASIIFGITISEDIFTIGIMAVLTGLAMTGQFQAWELARQLGFLGMFLAGVMLFGLLLLPKLLNRLVSRLQDDETVLLIVMGICFGIALIAERMQFSLALGAFLVGAVVSESSIRKRVIDRTMGLRYVFSAVFFVTIGMMVDPMAMWANKWCILMFVLVVVLGKTMNSFVACYVTGQSFRESFQIGVGLAQIGDFAYLVALLGMTLQDGASPFPEMYQIAVGVSILTTLMNPFLLRHSGECADWMLAHMPTGLRAVFENYTAWSSRTNSELKQVGMRKQFVRTFGLIIVNAVMMGVVFMVGSWLKQYENLWSRMPAFVVRHGAEWMWIACTVLSVPFFVNVYLLSLKMSEIVGNAFMPRSRDRLGYWQARLRHLTGILVQASCLVVLGIEYLFLSNLLFFNWWVFGGMFVVLAIVCWRCWDRLKAMVYEAHQTLHDVMSGDGSLDDDDVHEGPRTMVESRECVVLIPENAGVIGVSLKKLRLRNHTGATISRIIRANGEKVETPGADDSLQAGDTACMLCQAGTEEKVKAYLTGEHVVIHEEAHDAQLHTTKIVLPEKSGALNVSLRKLRLRNQTGATVYRITRASGDVLRTPGPNDELHAGDTVEMMCKPGTEADVRDYLCGEHVQVYEDSLLSLMDLHVEKVVMPEGSALCGKKLCELRLRNETGVTIVGIERDGKPLGGLPGPDDILVPGDVVAFMGTSAQIDETRKLAFEL